MWVVLGLFFKIRSEFEMATLKGMCWRTNWILEKVI
jgi:hypothetical protein